MTEPRIRRIAWKQTAGFIWKSCDGTNSVDDISRLVGDEFGGSVSKDFVWLAIDQLNNDNLLKERVDSKFKGISRREVIRKLGFASMIALPVVASLALPNSVSAQASCANMPCNLTGAPPVTCNSPCVCSQPTGPGICQ